ncbi:MAG: hypothetical protein RIT07_1021, partial [Bacteroidota bacterium]
MGVTRLKRKEAKIRARSNRRVQTIKRLKSIVLLASPFKGESGYKESFTKEQLQKIRDQTVRVKKGVHKIT